MVLEYCRGGELFYHLRKYDFSFLLASFLWMNTLLSLIEREYQLFLFNDMKCGTFSRRFGPFLYCGSHFSTWLLTSSWYHLQSMLFVAPFLCLFQSSNYELWIELKGTENCRCRTWNQRIFCWIQKGTSNWQILDCRKKALQVLEEKPRVKQLKPFVELPNISVLICYHSQNHSVLDLFFSTSTKTKSLVQSSYWFDCDCDLFFVLQPLRSLRGLVMAKQLIGGVLVSCCMKCWRVVLHLYRPIEMSSISTLSKEISNFHPTFPNSP